MAFGQLKTATIREFNGGLNVVQDDLNMETKYSKIEINMFNNINGTKSKRYGTRFLKDVKNYPEVENIFENCTHRIKKYMTLYNDNTMQLNIGDYITLYKEDGTTDEIRLTILSLSSNRIKVDKPDNYSSESNFTKYKAYNKKTRLWTDFITDINITFVGNFIYLDKPVYSLIKSNDVIKILEGENVDSSLIGKEFTVFSVNSSNNNQLFDRDTITIDISEAEFNYSSQWLNGKIKYTKIVNKEEDYVRFSVNIKKGDDESYAPPEETETQITNSAYFYNINQTVIPVVDEIKNLLIGHTISIYSDENFSNLIMNSYIYDIELVFNNDTNEYDRYFIIQDEQELLKNYTTLYIKHDNRSITGTKIINCYYFIDKIIGVTNIGEVIMIDGEMNSSIIWNNKIAETLNKENDVSGWHETSSVCFAPFNGILTIWNGIDKPLAIDLNSTKNPCNYLYDAGTNSNAHVPIAKYAFGFNHYLICGNIIDNEGSYPDRISISARDSIGTFYSGDENDLSNDAVQLDLGTIISSNKQVIKGISRYRDKLVIGFDSVSLFGTLGTYEEVIEDEELNIIRQIHTPNFEDLIEDHGCISNRTFASINNELICLDYNGVPLFKRTGIYSIILPTRISNLIFPEIYTSITGLKENIIEDNTFSLHNPKNNQYLLFIPQVDEENNQIGSICFAYTLDNVSNAQTTGGSWSKFLGWNFNCGCTTALNEIILIKNTKIYKLGNINDEIYADYIDDPDYPPKDEEDISGKEIYFEWEFPWADFGNRASTKHSRYISISSKGTSPFTIDLYTDYIYYNNVYNKRDPQLSLDFVGGDSVGWGNGKQNYGGSRITNNELLFAWTTKFKIAKFSINGSSKYKLDINSLTIYYQSGNIRR